MSCAHWLYLLDVLLLVGAAFISLDPWPGDVELLAVGLLEPRHNVPASAVPFTSSINFSSVSWSQSFPWVLMIVLGSVPGLGEI